MPTQSQWGGPDAPGVPPARRCRCSSTSPDLRRAPGRFRCRGRPHGKGSLRLAVEGHSSRIPASCVVRSEGLEPSRQDLAIHSLRGGGHCPCHDHLPVTSPCPSPMNAPRAACRWPAPPPQTETCLGHPDSRPGRARGRRGGRPRHPAPRARLARWWSTRSRDSNAASIAAMVLTTESLITDLPDKKQSVPVGGGYGGDMDY